MALSVSRHGAADGVVWVSAAGEVDLTTAAPLEQAIVASVTQDGVREVVVDLAGVGFLDSTGINVLLKGRRLADEAGTSYRVSGARDMVLEILEITGVWQHLTGEPG
jgi:anti-sigma B factor antagonist